MRQPKISSIIRPAWNIYRTNFKTYYSLALIGSFWMIIPIYGWAKYTTMMGLLTRLAYGELTGNSESVIEARQNIRSKTRSFINLGWRVNLRLLGSFFRLDLLVLGIFMCLISAVVSLILLQSQFMPLPFVFLIVFLYLCASSYYYCLWIYRWYLCELPLALEADIDAVQSIYITEQLAENYPFSTKGIIFIFTSVFVIVMSGAEVVINPWAEQIYDLIASSTFLIANIPVNAAFLLCFWVIYIIFVCSICIGTLFIPCPIDMFLLFLVPIFSKDKVYIFLMLYIAIAALFIPLWQSIKAVIYYRLKLRNEYMSLSPDRSS